MCMGSLLDPVVCMPAGSLLLTNCKTQQTHSMMTHHGCQVFFYRLHRRFRNYANTAGALTRAYVQCKFAIESHVFSLQQKYTRATVERARASQLSTSGNTSRISKFTTSFLCLDALSSVTAPRPT